MKDYLDALVRQLEQPSFIDDDPISIPHGFEDPRDQEVIGLFAALLAWGRRQTVLSKMAELCERMGYHPHRFVYDYRDERDAPKLAGFKHRTFQPADARWLVRGLSAVIRRPGGLEGVFADGLDDSTNVGPAIQRFSEAVLTAVPGTPPRLAKHLARPSTGSACKRLCMYLRWMVRSGPVDLGIWNRIEPRQLVLPLDVHAGRSARALGLVTRSQNDWKAAIELTEACRTLDADDPCRYDYVFFGTAVLGVPLDMERAYRPAANPSTRPTSLPTEQDRTA